MKKLVAALLCVASLNAVHAQTDENKMPALDKSPMDMAYFPNDYPILKTQDKATDPLIARVIYSRPQKANRVIFGDLVKYKEVWRLGANEATELDFYKDVKIGGKKVPKGRYTLYAIPDSAQWTLIINKDTDVWGAFKYNDKKDVVRIAVPVQTTAEPLDPLSMKFEKTGNGTNLVVGWDTQMASLPIDTK